MPGFNLEPTFFPGCKPEFRPHKHELLWELLWYGEGRWDWNTLYYLPIPWLRFWTKKLNQILEVKYSKPDSESTNKQYGPPPIAKPPF